MKSFSEFASELSEARREDKEREKRKAGLSHDPRAGMDTRSPKRGKPDAHTASDALTAAKTLLKKHGDKVEMRKMNGGEFTLHDIETGEVYYGWDKKHGTEWNPPTHKSLK